MKFHQLSRRAFIKGSVSALALSSVPVKFSFAQTTIRVRPEWQQFRNSPNYASFIDAIRTMRANTNASSRSSWQFWVNVHVNYCPHTAPYFLAWHRGYLYYFEQQLRIVSGNNNLVLPYWDYYRNPRIPAEFTDPARGNPLYVSRVNTNVYNALTLRPFDPSVWNFQRGTSNAFEPLFEDAPHNPVHNIIGGVMQTMQSPQDPIFYLHHANVDRLWHAWALPDGKGIPWTSSPYWSGSFTYAPNLTLPRSQCYHPNWVGTDYADTSKPTTLPPQAMKKGEVIRVQAQQGRGVARPPEGKFANTGPRAIGAGRRSLGGASDIGLMESSVSVRVPLQKSDSDTLKTIVTKAKGKTAAPALPADAYKSVDITLDNVRILPPGKLGGFFYKVYLNLPGSGEPSAAPDSYLLGTIGAFEIDAASHRGGAHHGGDTVQLSFPATEQLANVLADDIKDVTVSLVRVNGDNSPKGRVITVGELRVELSTDEPFDLTPPEPAPSSSPYHL
jgi:tyrosinase